MIIGINKRAERPGVASDLCQQAVVIRSAISFERATAFLNQPQAHDVLEQPIGSVDTPFIGHVQFQSSLSQHSVW